MADNIVAVFFLNEPYVLKSEMKEIFFLMDAIYSLVSSS